MFGQSRDSHALPLNVREIDRRLRSIEQSLGRAGTRVASRAVGTADNVSEAVSSALSSLVDRLHGLSIGDDAAKFGGEALKFGNDTLRRVSKEVAHRPLGTLAVAVGVGLLLGAIIQRR
jgi:ElaB/YqjD/DUF883 family membrane-anchored ribosome-binding protein